MNLELKIPHWYVSFRQFFQPYYVPNPKYYEAPLPEEEKPLTEKKAKSRQISQKQYVKELNQDLNKLSSKIKNTTNSNKKKRLREKYLKLREEYEKELTELNNLREFLGLKPMQSKKLKAKQEKERIEAELRADEITREEIERSPLEELEVQKRPIFNRKKYYESLERGRIWYKKNKKGKYALKVNTFNYPRPLDDVANLEIKPELGTIFAYHDKSKHQVLGHFAPRAGFKYGKDTRNNNKRKQLYPIVFPKYGEKVPFDRTHLIPFGYHNSENDMRLLIGWDSWQNRNPLNEWEKRAKLHEQNIYWLASIERTKDGAEWHYQIFDEDFNPIDKLDLSMGTPEEPIEFVWGDGYYNNEEIWSPQKKITVVNHS